MLELKAHVLMRDSWLEFFSAKKNAGSLPSFEKTIEREANFTNLDVTGVGIIQAKSTYSKGWNIVQTRDGAGKSPLSFLVQLLPSSAIKLLQKAALF